MDRISLVEALERDGVAFADSCAAAGLDTPVAACPGWNVAELVWHLGEVHFFWRTIVGDRMSSFEEYQPPQRPADAELLDFYRAGLAHTLQVLTDADPATPVWTWSTDNTAGFVIRRMAHETAVHRWDAEQAAKRDMPIEAALASDGIDEFLQHFFDDGADAAAAIGGSVHLHCEDVAGEWAVRVGDNGALVVTRQHVKCDCAIRGSASDVLLALWRRQPLSVVSVVGDADVAARFVAQTTLE
jgi:uncharacterized protein (TIGR03083 family)